MTKYNITLENDQNIILLNKQKIIENSSVMFNYFLKSPVLLENSALSRYFNPDLTIGFDLYICDNSAIQKINNDYRQKNEPTDVISFALFADCEESRIIANNQVNLGQIVISAEKIVEFIISNKDEHKEKQSLQMGYHALRISHKQDFQSNIENEFRKEFYFILAHGILHLLGFDHKDENSLEFMLDTQKKMVENIQNVKI